VARKKDADEVRMTVMEHLGELRKRIGISLAALLVGIIASFIAKDPLFEILKRPLVRADGLEAELVTLSPIEPFMTVLRVAVYGGFLVALPVVLYQFWAFVMPALYETERKRVLPYVFFTTALFLAGVAFAYFLVLPIALVFLVGYGGDIFTQQLRASEYIGFVGKFLLGFGAVFEIPVLILLLSAAELVSVRWLRKSRKYALLVIAAISMVLTPADPLSMLLMMGPLYLLFEFGILLARLTERRRRKKQQRLAEAP
jgi:sec-independent protein translocase protein TatC